jgi:hypothetical protein
VFARDTTAVIPTPSLALHGTNTYEQPKPRKKETPFVPGISLLIYMHRFKLMLMPLVNRLQALDLLEMLQPTQEAVRWKDLTTYESTTCLPHHLHMANSAASLAKTPSFLWVTKIGISTCRMTGT